MTIEQTVLACGILFVGCIVRSSLGFGEALIAMPLLAFVVPLQVASPLVAAISMTNAILILAREWRAIRLGEAVWLVIPALAGIPAGAWLLQAGEELLVKSFLAIVVLTFATWSLIRPNRFQLSSGRLAPVFGFVAGVLGGAYNTAGPPLVIFGTLRQWPPESFRANLQGYFLLGGSTVLAMHLFHGRFTLDVVQLYVWCLPLIGLASVIGRWLTVSIPTTRFFRIVHVGLLMIGTLLLVTCLRDILAS